MELKKIIENTIREFLNEENSKEEIIRGVLKDKFKKEQNINEFIIEKQNKAKYDIILFLISLGFYKNTEYNIHYIKNNNFKPSLSDYVGSFTIVDFIKEHRKYLGNKYDVSEHSITDKMWDDNMNNVIIPNIKKISKKYNFELSDKPFLYGHGDLLIELKIPDEVEYGGEYPQIIMKNPEKIISTKEFLGIEDRIENKKFLKHTVDSVDYKFLLNPLNQDKYFGTGDRGIFGNLFGGKLNDFLKIKNLEFEKTIIQINKNFRNYDFIIGGDGIYKLEDVKKFKDDEDYTIKKIGSENIFYDILMDLSVIQKKNDLIKMIVFLSLGGDIIQSKNGGVYDKHTKKVYYPYFLK